MAAENNKRIAKNTMFLYVRMLLIMGVNLYTSRIVLQTLGVEDFGIYNVVGSIVVAFSFISGPLGSATQRYYNFELGRDDKAGLNLVFNHSVLIYALLSILIFIVIEIGGFWFIKNKMLLPNERLDVALFAFHFSVFAFVVSLFKTPFESLIIAHEKMSYYAYVSIVEVVLNLLNAYSLSFFSLDKLKLYAINRFLIIAIVFACVFIYTRRKFVYVYFVRIWNKNVFKSLLSFSGWSLFGSVASMSANQGLNILLNVFFGVIVNAAMGIASQVNGAVNQFVSNFQVAFRPQIVKLYASGQLDQLRSLIMNTSKYSFLLLGSPNEKLLGEAVRKELHAPCVDLIGLTGMAELVEAIRRSSLLLCNDSGPMHIAAALGTPVVSLFGPTDPVLTGPFTRKAEVLTPDLPCLRCFRRECAEGLCHRSITPEAVKKSMEKQLGL